MQSVASESEHVTFTRHMSVLLTGVDFGKDADKQRTKQDRKKSFTYVRNYIRKERCLFMSGMFYLFLGMLADLALPIYIGLATQDVNTNGGANLASYTVIVLLVIAIGSIGTGNRSTMFSFFADNVSSKIRDDYFASITEKNVAFFDVNKVGDILSR